MATLGTKLINLRSQKKISLDKLSDELGISKTAISKWEADKAKPSIENLLKICNFFEIDMYDLLEEASNINQTNAKFKGHSYIVNPNNSTITFQVPFELLSSLIDNQQKIITLFEHQNQLVNDLLKKSKV